MTTSIQNLPKDCLVEIFQYIPVEKREILEEVCKLFQKIVLDPYFEKERQAALQRQKEINDVADQYPKDLVKAIGGPKVLYDLPTIDLTPELKKKFFRGDVIFPPTRGKSSPFFLFQYKIRIALSILARTQDNILIAPATKGWKKKMSGWKWFAGVNGQDRDFVLDKTLCDYIRRILTKQPCGFMGRDGESTNDRDTVILTSPSETTNP